MLARSRRSWFLRSLPCVLALLAAISTRSAAGADTDAESPGWSAHFFPLLDWSADPLEERREAHLLWPLGYHGRLTEGDRWVTAVHPLFSVGQTEGRYEAEEAFWDVVYPMIGGRTIKRPHLGETMIRRWALPLYFHRTAIETDRRSERSMVFPLLYWGSRTKPAKAGYFVFFPFVWWIDKGAEFYFPLYNPGYGPSRALWPIYGEFRDSFNADRLRFALWPLWVQSRKDEERRRAILWPVIGWGYGGGYRHARLWPLAGRTAREGVGHQVFYLWPLGHHIRRGETAEGRPAIKLDAFLPLFINGRLGPATLQYYFPVWGELDRPGRTSTAWFWPIYSITRNDSPEWFRQRWLYFVGVRRRGGEEYETRLFPLYGFKSGPDYRHRFVLYPIWFDRWNREETGRVFSRQYLLPFWFNEVWHNGTGERIKQRRALWPLYRSIQREDGSTFFGLLNLWPGTGNKALERNWAPLWTLYSSSTNGRGTSERRVLGRLVRWRASEEHGREWEVNFLLGRFHRTFEGEGRWTLLGWDLWGGEDE